MNLPVRPSSVPAGALGSNSAAPFLPGTHFLQRQRRQVSDVSLQVPSLFSLQDRCLSGYPRNSVLPGPGLTHRRQGHAPLTRGVRDAEQGHRNFEEQCTQSLLSPHFLLRPFLEIKKFKVWGLTSKQNINFRVDGSVASRKVSLRAGERSEKKKKE